MRNISRWSGFVTLAVWMFLVMVSLGGCGGGAAADADDAADDADDEADDEASGSVVDENGDAITSVDTNDAVNCSLSGLTANTQYSISVTDANGTSLSPSGGFLATTDEEGNLPSSTIVQDLSTTSDSSGLVLRNQGIVPRIKAVTGTLTITVTDSNGDAALDPITVTVADGKKVFCSDSEGTARASFTPAEEVFVTLQKGASGTLSDGTYTCYVFPDNGGILDNQGSLTGTTASVTVASGTGTVSVGTYASGTFDVVCDLDGDVKYDSGSDPIARAAGRNPCFTIQSENSGNDIIGQICSDAEGNYRDIFDPNATNTSIRDVFAWIASSEQSLVQHTIGVRKYVVPHKATWTDGDSLSDVTECSGEGGFERDSVQGFCTNESPWLVWPRACLSPGCFDCVVDVNQDGLYTKGTDFVDNIDNSGDNSLGGMCVASSACSDNISITSHSDGDSVTTTAITLAGTVSGSPASGKVTITQGTQSNTVELSVASGTFSANIPLFNGANKLTIFVFQSDGTVCAKTISVTSSASGSSDEALRAQLTWDGSTDMDLHLVKPSGEYANSGFGNENSVADCNYRNCKVGLDGVEGTGDSGEGTYSIDWGARLDVDCISCGNGIENIWMDDVETAGEYKVYVDAYSGTETDVQVTIFVNGANTGSVTCGDMSSDTATDSCFVGTWNSATGIFTEDGSKATDF